MQESKHGLGLFWIWRDLGIGIGGGLDLGIEKVVNLVDWREFWDCWNANSSFYYGEYFGVWGNLN